MKDKIEEHIKIKISLALNSLLASKKANPQATSGEDSYNKIALSAELRKATVSDIFNMRSLPKSSTLIRIIEAMGSSLSEFAIIYESITESDVKKHNKEK